MSHRTGEAVMDTIREQVLVAVHDTLREVTTVTVQLDANHDTVFRHVVTDRDRIRDHAAVRDKEEKVVVKTDTVFIAVRDSILSYGEQVMVQDERTKASSIVSVLKWIFWIIMALGALLLITKLRTVKRL